MKDPKERTLYSPTFSEAVAFIANTQTRVVTASWCAQCTRQDVGSAPAGRGCGCELLCGKTAGYNKQDEENLLFTGSARCTESFVAGCRAVRERTCKLSIPYTFLKNPSRIFFETLNTVSPQPYS